MPSQNRADAVDAMFLERELNQVKSKTYDKKYAQLRGREFVPVSREISPGAKTFTYKQYDGVGVAKIISSYADDLPRANVKVKEFQGIIKTLANAYGYSVEDLLAAQFAQRPLDVSEAEIARRGFEEAVDRIIAFGDAEHGLKGLLNQPNAQNYVVPNGQSGFSDFARKTPTEILKDLNAIVNKPVQTTNGVETADTLLLAIDQYTLIASTPMFENGGSDVTILSYFMKNNPFIKRVEHWWRLKGAGGGGTDRMVAYRLDPDALHVEIPMEFTQYPVQQKGLSYEIPCMGKIGGVVAPYPMAIVYGDGI